MAGMIFYRIKAYKNGLDFFFSNCFASSIQNIEIIPDFQNEDQSQHLSTVTSTSKATTTIAYKSLQQLRREFSNRDLNKDGKISREEFKIISQRCYRANLQN